MEATDIVLGLGVVVIGGGALLVRRYRSPSQRARRLFAGVARRSIAQVREGDRVCVQGTVKIARQSLEAPVSGARCAAFTARFEVNERSNTWRTRGEESGLEEFILVDETGEARVAPQPGQSRLLLAGRFTQTTDSLEPGARVEAFLARHGHRAGRPEKRLIESTIEEGDRVAILGRARFEAAPASTRAADGYRDPPRRLVLEAADDGELVISNMPSVLR